MSDSNQHRLKLSIDINSIKEHSFLGVIYAHYSHCPQIGIKQQFRTTPSLEVTKPFVEMQFINGFASYIIDLNKEELQQIFAETSINIELYHQDRLKKDQLIGNAIIKLSELLKSPIRKNSRSYARVLDAYYPIDELNEEPKRIGLLRCICYLEDLGPKDQLQQQELQVLEQIGADPGLPTLPLVDDPDKQQVILELHSLEHKVIWELDTWKKSEEAKFKVLLKQKEYDLTNKLYGEFKQKEIDRDRQFKQALAQIQLLENKIKSKGNDLQKREAKIIQLEEEVKQKLIETAKIIKQKDEEMGILIKRQKDEKLSYEKEKTVLNLKLTDALAANQKLEEENKKLKKDMDKSPIAVVKGTLQEKTQEITNLKKEIDNLNQIKDQYKQYYEKMRDELIRQKQQVQENTIIQQQTTFAELVKLRNELQEIKQTKIIPQSSYKIEENINNSQQQIALGEKQQQKVINPFKNVLVDDTNKKQQLTNPYQIRDYPNQKLQSDLQRLLQEREYLIESGEYQENDPLIKQLTKQIQDLGGE